MSLKRLDQIILQHFPELSRTKIQTLIEKDKILICHSEGQWVPVGKASRKVDPEEYEKGHFKILEDEEIQFVSRGALKLKAALEKFQISTEGKMALDMGLSTGGFSDLLLKGRVKKILGVDVGSGQLHPSLRNNERLMWRDKVNGRNPLPSDLLKDFFAGADLLFDLIVVDVSFISLEKILPPLKSILRPNGHLVSLVKPQFELSKADLNNHGVVKSNLKNQEALEKILNLSQELGFRLVGHCPSPILGDQGNQEHLMVLSL